MVPDTDIKTGLLFVQKRKKGHGDLYGVVDLKK